MHHDEGGFAHTDGAWAGTAEPTSSAATATPATPATAATLLPDTLAGEQTVAARRLRGRAPMAAALTTRCGRVAAIARLRLHSRYAKPHLVASATRAGKVARVHCQAFASVKLSRLSQLSHGSGFDRKH
jgi:hypothetical protein